MDLPVGPSASVEELASALLAIDKQITELRMAKTDLEARLYDAMTDKVVDLPPPIGRIERTHTGVNERWESEQLFKLLVHTAVDPDGTGELVSTSEALGRLQDMVKRCVPLSPSMGWRKTGLRSYLPDDVIDQYVTRSGGRKSIRFGSK